jgi:glycosyltransferase involved in cell wall biosynthesis
MLGWEFPPYFAGGVGIVCAELSKALAKKGVEITYLMPHGPKGVSSDYVKLLSADSLYPNLKIKFKRIGSMLTPYVDSDVYAKNYAKYLAMKKGDQKGDVYGATLLEEMFIFAEKARLIAELEDFDLIHAHDYTTYPAAIAAKEASGKPLIVHVHITQFDITGGQGADPEIYKIEKEGMEKADLIIALCDYVKRNIIKNYGIPADKIRIVHNAVQWSNKDTIQDEKVFHPNDKIVLYLGRIALQKGPDYFVEAAKRVLERDPSVKFVMAGGGHMLPQMIERAARLGIVQNFVFPGFVSRNEGNRLYKMADVFVSPSVSDPFGIVPLEAMYMGTPVIVSKQSGVSELLSHCLKVDFWDVNEMANKILAALKYSTLSKNLSRNGLREIQKFKWSDSAAKCLNIYRELLQMRGGG